MRKPARQTVIIIRKHAALYIAIALSLLGCVTLLTARSEEALAGYGFLLLALMFLPIWNSQRNE